MDLHTGTLYRKHGKHADMKRTGHGHLTDEQRASYGLLRTAHGRSTVIVLSRDACRAGGCVFVRCSFCVRSSFGRVLCGVRLVLVRVAFVRGGLSTGQRWTCDGLLSGGGRAGIRLMPTFCDISRWAAARRRTTHGRETDTPRATHGRTTGGRRTGNGHQTGGGRAGIRLLPTICDTPRWAAVARRRAIHGLATGLLRTHDGLHTDF